MTSQKCLIFVFRVGMKNISVFNHVSDQIKNNKATFRTVRPFPVDVFRNIQDQTTCAGVPSVLEPSGVSPENDIRRDGLTLVAAAEHGI